MKRFALLLAVALPCLLILSAATSPKFSLTIDNIMRGPGLYGYPPSQPRWSGSGDRIYFQWKQAGDPILKPTDTYVVSRDGSGLRKLSDAEAKIAPPTEGSATRDKRRTFYSRVCDILLYDSTTGVTRQLTHTEDAETNPHFTLDEKRVVFTRANNLY